MPDIALASVEELHQDRTHRIRAILKTDPIQARGSGAGAYCLAHHALEGAERAARAGDTTTFDWYRTHPDATAPALLMPTAVGPRIVVAPDAGHMLHSAISETAYYVLGPETAAAPPELQELAAAAYTTGSGAGFAELLTNHAVVTCLLRRKPLGDTLVSWTITRLPGTVFSDYTDEPAVLARDLIHEAGHNWLNDALTATNCEISDEAVFYSPWRKTKRPAFGFLHACWAFPLTMIYTARVLPKTSGAVHHFLTAYLSQQRALLAATTDDHLQALALIADPELRRLLHAVHTEALGL
ncbi:aKG-HExxH-type peptide beta-hydroxylase [Streptomyces sp. NPDC059631]|uniref:aKG-HExxH-type peptide beta-hydroxylase n=1 Tax=unclassified Streptomyces TaxID=2593676 RepID=UPI0036CD8D9A